MALTEFTEGSVETRTTREAAIVQYIGHVHVLAIRRVRQPCILSSPVRNDRNSAGFVDRDSCRGRTENSQHRSE